jgi:hypothetical protein
MTEVMSYFAISDILAAVLKIQLRWVVCDVSIDRRALFLLLDLADEGTTVLRNVGNYTHFSEYFNLRVTISSLVNREVARKPEKPRVKISFTKANCF